MRKILFRGKRIDNGEWLVSRTLLQNSDDERFCWMPVYGDKFGTVEDDKGNILRMEYGTLYRVDPVTVGQYIGLKDKNGKRIFEGDIVTRILFDKPYQYEVVYRPGYASFDGIRKGGFISFGNDADCFEVIGNIHDNPELMEVR